MDKEWSEKNKRIQILLGKETTYKEGIELLIEFRKEMFEQVSQIVNGYPVEAFYQMPAGRSIMPALLQHYSRIGNALTRFAAWRRTLMDAMNAQSWKNVQKAFLDRKMIGQLPPRHRQCCQGDSRLCENLMLNIVEAE